LTSPDEEENICLSWEKATFFVNMFYKFRFEQQFYPTLNRVPLHVRMKLDVTGIKLSLNEWLAFTFEERNVLCHLPVDEEEEKQTFKQYLNFLCRKYTGREAARTAMINPCLWCNNDRIPDSILKKAPVTASPITLEEWRRWPSHSRYAVYKTAVSKSEPEQFLAVLEELREAKT
jgi:hypothetical protein